MTGRLFNFKYTRFPGEDFKNLTRDRQCGFMSRLIDFLKPRCLGKAIRKKTRPFNEPGKQMQLLQNTCQLATLGDWLLASPALNHHSTKACEFYSPRLSKNALHLSVDSGKDCETMKESTKLDNGYSICKTKGGNAIKRVQFRIPEVVDVFIIESPEELVESHLHIES